MSDSNLNQNTSEARASRPLRRRRTHPRPRLRAPGPRGAQAENLYAPHGAGHGRLRRCRPGGRRRAGVVGRHVGLDRLGPHRDTHHAHEDDRDRPCPLLGLPAMRDDVHAEERRSRVPAHSPRARVGELQLRCRRRYQRRHLRQLPVHGRALQAVRRSGMRQVLPVHAIHSDEETGARTCGSTKTCASAAACALPGLPVEHAPRRQPRPAYRRSAFRAVAAPSSAPTAPSSSSIGRISPRRSSTRAWFPRPPSSRLKR